MPGVHFFIHVMLSCVQLVVTLCTVARQAPLSTGFPRQECWGVLPFTPPGDLPDPGMEATSPASCIAGGFSTCWAIGKSCQLLGKAFWVNSRGKWCTCYTDNKDADSSQRKLQGQRSHGRICLSYWRNSKSTQFLSTLLTPRTWGLLPTPVLQLSVLQLSSGTTGEGPHSLRLFPLQYLSQVGACPSDQLGINSGGFYTSLPWTSGKCSTYYPSLLFKDTT